MKKNKAKELKMATRTLFRYRGLNDRRSTETTVSNDPTTTVTVTVTTSSNMTLIL